MQILVLINQNGAIWYCDLSPSTNTHNYRISGEDLKGEWDFRVAFIRILFIQ